MSSPAPRHTRPIRLPNVEDNTPTAKVTSAGLAGSAATILIFIAAQYGIEIDGGTGAAIVAFASTLAGYIKKSRPTELDL